MMFFTLHRLLLLFILVLSTSAFANMTPSYNKTLLTLKLYFEPHAQKEQLTYMITLPKGEYYSFYLGSDLPTWHLVRDRVIQGNFNPVELVNIRIHQNYDWQCNHKINGQSTASLTLIDSKNARVVWQGKLNYGSSKQKPFVITEIDNQKYYETKLKFEREMNTISLETVTR